MGIEDSFDRQWRVREEKEALRKIAFARLLDGVLPVSTEPKPYHVVNIGCGDGRDTQDLQVACKAKNWLPKVYSVDSAEPYITHASASFGSEDNVFVCADAASPVVLSAYPQSVDLVLLRHPEILAHNAHIWQRMLAIALSRLAENGRVLVTTYSEKEFERIGRITTSLPITAISAGLNPQCDTSLLGWNNKLEATICPDQYMALFVTKTTLGNY
ncbi:class I SAM-dependent methyltransferase [Candidatus Gracilibacteria bacterium]|nr:class I SAM-dependent methyltransferase [Candidatus Gracilibacteria bacterium]